MPRCSFSPFPMLKCITHNMNACEQCCCFTLSKRDETAPWHSCQRNVNILIDLGRHSVVMLPGLRLQAAIVLWGNTRVRRREAEEAEDEGNMIWGCLHPHSSSPAAMLCSASLSELHKCMLKSNHRYTCMDTWSVHMWVYAGLHGRSAMHTPANPHSTIIHNHVFWRHDVTHEHLLSLCRQF